MHDLVYSEFRKMATHYLQRIPMMNTVTQQIISTLGMDANQECRHALTQYMEMEDMIFEQVERCWIQYLFAYRYISVFLREFWK